MDYDPSADLEKIKARLLAINFADDAVNPPELGVLEAGNCPHSRGAKRRCAGVAAIARASECDRTRRSGRAIWPIFWRENKLIPARPIRTYLFRSLAHRGRRL